MRGSPFVNLGCWHGAPCLLYACLVGALLIPIDILPAATLTWDADSGTVGAQDGSGNWDMTISNWIDGGSNVTWTAGDSAVFGAGGSGTATVTLAEPISAESITFTTGADYVLAGSTLTLTGVVVNAPVATINAPIEVSGVDIARQINVSAGNQLTIQGAITGTTHLNKAGSGTLILDGDHSGFSKHMDVSAGLVKLVDANGVPGSYFHVTNAGAVVELTGGITVASSETIYLSGGATSDTLATFYSTNGNNVWNGNVVLHNGAGNRNVGVAAGGSMTLGGIVSGVADRHLVKIDTGTLILSNSNTYVGATTVSAGVLNIRHGNALGTTAGGTTVNSGAALEVQGGITVGESLTLNGDGIGQHGALRSIGGNNVWNGAIVENGASIGVDADTLTIHGQINGAGALRKVGGGTLVLTNENTYAGPTYIDAGTVDLRHDNALGTEAVNVASGATVRVQNNIVINTGMLTINGGTGLYSVAGDNRWNTAIQAGGSSSNIIQVDTGSTLTLAGSLVNGAGYFYKSGSGTLILDGDSSDFTRHMDVAEGKVILSNANGVPGEYFHVKSANAVVELTGGIEVGATMTGGTARKIYLTGGASSSTLATLYSSNGNNIWNGEVILHSDAGNRNIGVAADSTLTIAGVLSGNATDKHVVKIDEGALILSGANTYLGNTTVAAGSLLVNGALNGGGTVTVDAGATLGGTGTIAGLVDGQGLLSPGASAGILSVATIDPAGGMDYAFEFGQTGSPDYTNTGASVNDVLRLTSDTPATGALDSDNAIDVYLGVTDLELRDEFRGGVYVDEAVDAADRALFLGTVEGADYQYYVLGDGNGTHSFEGLGYYTLDEYDPFLRLELSTVAETASFATGSVSGSVLQFRVVPEPVLPVLFAFILPALLLRRRSRDHHGRLSG